MNADARAFFVYRIYGDGLQLLYVGCTNRPYARWAEHRAQNCEMASRATSFRMAGPYTRAVARHLERVAAETEHPLFGRTPTKHAAIRRAMSWEQRRTQELVDGGWDYAAAWKLAAVEVKHQFPFAPTSYSDLRRPWEMRA